MAFRVEFSELAAEEFQKLDKAVRERIARKLRTVAMNPARYLTRLSSVDAFKIRVGDYRAIVDLDWQRRIVFILSVGHRSTVYR
ncbi:MAG: type II toxin-antitoxin system RelE/ParE family toxin [Nitrospirae bacterium]|nr:MAG: type II toxin-antitoxin system RelE/ParE family toxin [Nitrospirota bacterium]